MSDTLMAAIDLMIPPVCQGCQQKLPDGKAMLCDVCAAGVQSMGESSCPKCGSVLEEGVCENCRALDFDFELARSVYRYEEPLKTMIHNLKYREHTRSAKWLADGMAGYIAQNPIFQKSDYIMAVPLHSVRKRERGFNQSELIARRVAKLSGIQYIDAVKRGRYTASQTMLHQEQRLTNLKGAFRTSRPGRIAGKNILVIDDVFTTGSTLNEISKTLHAAGAARVFGLTACRA
ncbi:MAG TPA: ComF family protein [Candidatus Cloacimonadota bacterium]|nr:ComF family protein [Candidatus Cloacimonadota bacterium]